MLSYVNAFEVIIMAGKYSVPAEIRALKPAGISTNVKVVKGNYYVYEHLRVTDPVTGKRKNASGRYLGKITLEDGFIPADQAITQDDINNLDCGQYLIGYKNSSCVYDLLKKFFNPNEAKFLYCMGLIFFANGYTYMRDVINCYEGSVLSLMLKDLSMGEKAISRFYKTLGHRTQRMEAFEQALITNGSGYYAVDGHVILSTSKDTDLVSYGNKYRKMGNTQQNYMCIFDVEMNRPVSCKPFEGGTLDMTYVAEVFDLYNFRNTVFIVDAGFYSAENIKLFSADGNKYVVPMPAKYKTYKTAVSDISFTEEFSYSKGSGKKSHKSLISFKELATNDGTRRIMFRDEEMNMKLRAEFKSQVGTDDYHTNARYTQLKELFGLIILETNMTDPAAFVYATYKKRWKVETFYNHVKNQEQFKATHNRDYYVVQAESFIMTIEGMIYSEFMKVLQHKPDKILSGKSVNECISISARLKLSQHNDKTWHINKLRSGIMDLLTALNVDVSEDLPIKV